METFWEVYQKAVKENGCNAGETFALSMFRAGAEWQQQQSTWVSVKDRLPHSDKMVLCQMKSNNAIVSGYITRCLGDKLQVLTAPDFEFDDLMDYEPITWMPIPDCEED